MISWNMGGQFDQLPVLLFLVLHQFLYQHISYFYNFLELHSTLSEKYIRHQFSFFNIFTQTFYPPNGQNLLGVIKVFCQFYLECLLKYLFQKFIEKILQKYLMHQQWTAIVHILLKVQTTDYLVFFLEHFKNNYFDTSISNYLKIEFLEFFLY